MTNSQAVAYKGWMVRCSPAIRDFNRSNKHCRPQPVHKFHAPTATDNYDKTHKY